MSISIITITVIIFLFDIGSMAHGSCAKGWAGLGALVLLRKYFDPGALRCSNAKGTMRAGAANVVSAAPVG